MSKDAKEKFESWWWGNCANTYGEETKQMLYAFRMGLTFFHDGKSPYNIDMKGKRVLDIGGGPTSLLLKCQNVKGKVIDPLSYPLWTYERYKIAGIEFQTMRGEDVNETGYDEVWIYNVLQHTDDPVKIVENAKRAGKLLRIFEWVDTVSNEGHPHILTQAKLDSWIGGAGKTEFLTGANTCKGKCYYGVFNNETL